MTVLVSGGPKGAELGSQIGGGIGSMLEGLLSQHGESNVQGAMNNNMMGSMVDQLSQALQSAPGIPQFARDEMCQGLQDVQQSCPQEPTIPGCQQDTDGAMSGFIDKVVNKLVDQIMQKLEGGGCESGGSLQDMVRQAIEDVVREEIGGGAESGGGCAANGDSASGAAAGSAANDASDSGGVDTANPESSLLNECSKDEEKEKAKNEKCGGAGSWLVSLAKALGEMTGNHLQNMMKAQDRMEASEATAQDLNGKSEQEKADIKQEKGKDFTVAQAEFQAEAKLFGMCSDASSNVLKTLGEGLSTMAKKQ